MKIVMVCAGRIRSKTTEINELESVGTPRVSGQQNPPCSDGATASGSRLLSGKYQKTTGSTLPMPAKVEHPTKFQEKSEKV